VTRDYDPTTSAQVRAQLRWEREQEEDPPEEDVDAQRDSLENRERWEP